MNTTAADGRPNPAPSTILIADDDPRVRHALRAWIETDPRLRVAGEACTCGEVVAYDLSLHPRVILLDLGLPSLEDGLQALEVLAHEGTSRVIAMSLHGELRDRAMAAGACAFVEKGLAPELLLAALAAACDA
jgi:DNA-binding NarL/FixJ family response regulator